MVGALFVHFSLALSCGSHAPLLRPAAAATSSRLLQMRRHVAMVSLPFGGGGGSASGEPSDEVQAAYRLMGLDLDAKYDDIEVAYEELLSAYADNQKMKIRLAVAKDKVLGHILNARLKGASTAPKVFDPFDRPSGPKPLITIPPFLQGVMELPDRELLVKNGAVFGLIGLLPLVTAAWASTSVGLGFAISLYLLYNRGVPDQGDMGADMRPPKPKPLIMAVGITLLSGSIGATVLSASAGIVCRLLKFVTQELLIGLGASFGFFIAATLFKVQDEY